MRKNILLILTVFCFSTLLVAQSNDCSYGGTGLTVGSSCTTVTFNSNNNTDYWNSASGCAAGDDDDAWWWFTATSTSTTITYNSSDDAILHLFTGTCSTTMSHIACADNTISGNETIIFSTTIGTNYAIRIQRYNSSNNMNGNICVYNTPVAAGCTPNTTISSIPYVQTGFNTAGSGDDFSSSDACGSSYMGGDDYVFTYTPSVNECVSIALTNTSTWVGVFLTDGCPSMGASCVASNTNSSGNPSISSVNLTAGITYFITVSTFPSPQTTPFDISIIACPPPPSNDECAGATSVPVNLNASCGSVVSGTLNSATPSSQSNTCFGTANDDVWYSFTATNSTHYVDLLSVSGSPTDLYHSVYAGNCGSIGAPLVCSDANSSIVTGLTVGNTYYVRVYSYSSSTGATTTFNVCVGTPPPPPPNDNCSNAISLTMSTDGSCNSVSSTVASATNSMVSACGGTANDDVWFSFVATNDTAYVDRIAEFDSEVEVFNACSGASLGCQDAESSFLVKV